MKRTLVIALAIALMAVVFAVSHIGRFDHRYERRECYAHRTTLTLVTATDYVSGTIWEYEVTPDDPFEHGWVTLQMDDNNTDVITDDIVTGVIPR